MIDNKLESKILCYYRGGSELDLISYVLNVDTDTILKIIRNYKESSKNKNSYTIDFKKLVAERDSNGISRTDIKKELCIHENTVRKFCKSYGIAKKETETASELDEIFTYYSEGVLGDSCPKCSSKRFNTSDDNEKYCVTCGSNFKQVEDCIYILNWEYID